MYPRKQTPFLQGTTNTPPPPLHVILATFSLFNNPETVIHSGAPTLGPVELIVRAEQGKQGDHGDQDDWPEQDK